MKKLTFFVIILVFAVSKITLGQWDFNGIHIYNNNTGNVGIGTGTSFIPTEKLHINNGSNTASIMAESSYTGSSMKALGYFRIKNTATGDLFNMSLRKNGENHEMLQSCYDATAGLWREYTYYNYGTRKYEMRFGVMDAEFKNSGNILFNNMGSIGIGTSTPASSAALDINSTSKGFLPPRMTNAEILAIQNPENGLMVYCTDCASDGLGRISIFMAGNWYTLSINNCISPPSAPTENTHIPSENGIQWNWNAVPGAIGYKWNTSDNLATSTDMGLSLTKTESGLVCQTSYTRYVWAYNACGNSTSVNLTQTTSACIPWQCGNSITVNHIAGNVAPVSKSVIYGTVTNIPGEPSKCWITSNLGADNQANAVNDASEGSAGWYWQFNHMQGFKHEGSIITPSWTITNINENSDWTYENDPCRIELNGNWRIPSYSEWLNVFTSGNWTNWNGPWNSALKLHASGSIERTDGTLWNRGAIGYYWASTQANSTYSWYLYLNSGSCLMNNYYKAYGFSVRCIRE
jgi:hypothetical protein